MFNAVKKATSITLKKLFMPEIEEGVFFKNHAKENEIIYQKQKNKCFKMH